ncbi:hypothetical protein O181_057287 [Austropuccinia psidii MF-1]|uniref:Uncharacterized protein n=1 Tax=Austropuccinia psidii MF-1 TaxID=1389203 RepID=A0A9Q3HVA6_9BASI|nr:hypothetical protein [Austropuccinia psidii MF-1]
MFASLLIPLFVLASFGFTTASVVQSGSSEDLGLQPLKVMRRQNQRVANITKPAGKASNPSSGTINAGQAGFPPTNRADTEDQGDAEEEDEEDKKSSIMILATAIQEICHQKKYTIPVSDIPMVVKLIGKAMGAILQSGKPDIIVQAIHSGMESYKKKEGALDSSNPVNKRNLNEDVEQNFMIGKLNRRQNKPPTTKAASEEQVINEAEKSDKYFGLKLIAYALMDVHEKQEASPNKFNEAQLLQAVGRAIVSSASSGNPFEVAKAIEKAYESLAH